MLVTGGIRRHRLAELAIIDDVDPCRDLPSHDVADGRSEARLQIVVGRIVPFLPSTRLGRSGKNLFYSSNEHYQLFAWLTIPYMRNCSLAATSLGA
jgi:hypothetical protein